MSSFNLKIKTRRWCIAIWRCHSQRGNFTNLQKETVLTDCSMRLDLMRPDLAGKVFDKRSDQKSRMDKGIKEREFTIGEQVLLQNFGGTTKWLDGTVTEQTGPFSLESSRRRSTWPHHQFAHNLAIKGDFFSRANSNSAFKIVQGRIRKRIYLVKVADLYFFIKRYIFNLVNSEIVSKEHLIPLIQRHDLKGTGDERLI